MSTTQLENVSSVHKFAFDYAPIDNSRTSRAAEISGAKLNQRTHMMKNF